jgi:uncharacterized repeat protein (TIGR03809 family)
MSGSHVFRRLEQVAQKWRDLVDRRCAYFVQLHASGRWKNYYTEQQFLLLMDEAARLSETWVKLAPRPEDERGAASPPLSATNPPRRTAA